MKNIVSIFIIILFPLLISGQAIKKHSNDSIEEFALRNKPEKAEKISFIKVAKWNSKEGIFVFYKENFKDENLTSDNKTYTRLIGNLFIRTPKNNKYKRILIDTIHQEGGDPKIEDLFFANADNDQYDELIIITSWNQRHYQISGKIYGTFIYDEWKNLNIDYLIFQEEISKIVDGGFDGNREGEIVKAKYKNRDEIISKLKEMTH
ncbi:hypothetical protein [Autumnicola musiva]|uniref:Uncharacterized protein n=1 Tax=Autumnicola musiva TaxID=3075589 RepID=A0ABU3DB84_9FLAO|nr:hypothetical protein [Zunongwangia sp. F117]MDT0678795.1 hypothetical protein [Zunongwangia sp. F117]